MGQHTLYCMRKCVQCETDQPDSKFNAESFSPEMCFRCRVSGVSIGFGGYQKQFRGEELYGGTLASDNRHTVESARALGHDPVPVSKGVSHGLTANQTERLKKVLSK
jgi:hypothetical protein